MTVARNREETAGAEAGRPAFDVASVRAQFPALSLEVYGKPLVYLDSAASAQKPSAVLDAEMRCYREFYANVHRGVHYLSIAATAAYEGARSKVQALLNAPSARDIVFVRGTTEGINLVASTYGRQHVRQDDEVLVTTMEHHSNIVPWQMLCEATGGVLRVVPIDDDGALIMDEFFALLSDRTKIVAVGHVSNALGTINPVGSIVDAAHSYGAKVLIDGAQAVPHMAVDVQALDCDFYTFSGHKAFGPTGIGALYGKGELLRSMPPYEGGGEMISSVTFEKTEFREPPARFEAGTPNIAGAIALGAVVDFLDDLGYEAIGAHEEDLLSYATAMLEAVPGLTLVGTAERKAGVLSFLIDGVHAHDVGTIVDREGVAIRVGHHCAQPVMDRFGIAATARASLALYNTREDIDRLVEALGKVKEVFG
ncbi:MAG: cysteine desulfurase [Acidobacteriota bacterium]|nr:cysteine desulfurase [Acidobacteriota bacterium]